MVTLYCELYVLYDDIIKQGHSSGFHHLTAHVMSLHLKISCNKLEYNVTITEMMIGE